MIYLMNLVILDHRGLLPQALYLWKVAMMGKIFEEEKRDEAIRGTIEDAKSKNAGDVESSIPWLQSMR
jgi:hypothetical protein